MTEYIVLYDDSGKILDLRTTEGTAEINGNDITWPEGYYKSVSSNFAVTTTAITQSVGTTLDNALLLSLTKDTKKSEISVDCMNTIYGGFSCTISTGVTYHYPFSDKDQKNMGQQSIRILQGKVTTPFNWLVRDSSGNWLEVSHTTTDFNTVDDTANNFKWAQINQKRSLDSQVDAATTVSAIKAISWSPATY